MIRYIFLLSFLYLFVRGDGRFGEWSNFSTCTASCGGGLMYRQRKCDNPSPTTGEKDCKGPYKERRVCGTDPCPVDGGFGRWGNYSVCSVSCGGGTRHRQRKCDSPKPSHGGKMCEGLYNETIICGTTACPVDGGFGPWSNFTSCSVTCGIGSKYRERKCDNPSPAHGGNYCQGPFNQTEVCKMEPCKEKVANPFYLVTFFTGKQFLAGTYANIFVTLFGRNGQTKEIRIKSLWSSFKKGSSDSFKVNAGKDIGEINKIIIRSDDSGVGSGWYLVKVFVQHYHSNEVSKFYINKWLDDAWDEGLYVAVEATMPDKETCGITSSPRVVNGDTAPKGQWPWQAQIKIPIYKLAHHCGGTLIHPQYILTAAHCIVDKLKPNDYVITMGEHILLRDEGTEQRFRAVKVIKHPKWNSKSFEYDIAIMKLNKPVLLTSEVKAACLPEFGYQLPGGSKCYITGWGRLYGGGPGAYILNQAAFPSVDSKECNKVMSNVVPVKPSMVCGGGNEKAACNGDSGGPFVCPNKSGRFVVQGAVSWGKKLCPTINAYTVFSRVSAVVDWIGSEIYCKYLDI